MAWSGDRVRRIRGGPAGGAVRFGARASVLAVLAFWVPVLLTAPLAAQQPPVERAAASLEACVAAAREGPDEAASAAADRAESLYRAVERSGARVAGLTGRARVLSQCRVPAASFLRRGGIVEESNDLLEEALSIDPRDATARFTLGMNHYHTPSFLGRTDDAIRAFERLLADHAGEDLPLLDPAHYYLGELYLRADRPESARRIWSLGARRFPESAGRYRERAREAGLTLEAASPADPVRGGDPRSSAAASASVEASGSTRSGEAEPFEARVFALKPIVVEAGSYSVADPRSPTRLSKMDVYTAPGGTADVLQVFQTMPGVTRVSDGSDLYVRGGSPEESPIYLDGARLFYPGKFETLNGSVFGVLDPSVLASAYFSAGGFSARYGNALSGVLDLETEWRPESSHWRAGLNLASAGATVWQPLGAKVGAWGTGLLSETSALLATHGRTHEFPEAPSSAQGMVGLTFEPREGVRLRAVGLAESDETTAAVEARGYSGPFRSSGITRLAALSGELLGAGGRTALRATLSTSYRRTGFAFGVLDREREDRTLSARVDGDLLVAGLRLRAGVEGVLYDAVSTGHQPAGEEIAPGAPVETLGTLRGATSHAGVYVESELRLAAPLALVAGVRADQLPGTTGVTVDPRAALAYRHGDWTLRAGGGLYHQGPWRMRYDLPDRGTPSGVPTAARHLAVGVQREGRLGVRAEAYVKSYDDYVALGAGPQAIAGRARGLDALVQWRGAGALTGWLAYSLLDGELDLGDGPGVPSAVDVTHTLTAVGRLALGEAWELGATARYATGKPFTPVMGAAAGGGPAYGPVHAERLPDYVRLDGRLTRIVPVASGAFVLYLEALNLLDRPNVMAYTWDETYRDRQSIESFFADRTLVLGVEAQF